MPSAFYTACNPFHHAIHNNHVNHITLSRWHPMYTLVNCFYDAFTRGQGPLKQRNSYLSKQMQRSMYNLQRVIDQVMKNQLALEQLEHGIDDHDENSSSKSTTIDKNPGTKTITRSVNRQREQQQQQQKQQEKIILHKKHGFTDHRDYDDNAIDAKDAKDDDSVRKTNEHHHNSMLEKRIVEKLQSNHQQELDILIQQHEQVLSQLTRQYDDTNKRLQRKHQQDLDRTEERYKQQLNDQEQEYQQRLFSVENQLADEISRKRQLDLLIRENGDEIKRITAELVHQHDQVTKLESKLAYKPSVHHAMVQTDMIIRKEEEEEDDDGNEKVDEKEELLEEKKEDSIEKDDTRQVEEHEKEIERYKEQLQKLQESFDGQEERWQQKIKFYRNQVDTRMQQFYEQEYMVSRLQDHLQIIKEQLDQKEQQDNIREKRLLDLMDMVQQLREEKKELLARLLHHQQKQQQQFNHHPHPSLGQYNTAIAST